MNASDKRKYEQAYKTLMNMLDNGTWNYSINALNREYNGFKFMKFQLKWFISFLVVLSLVGINSLNSTNSILGIPGLWIFCFIITMLHQKSMEKFEQHVALIPRMEQEWQRRLNGINNNGQQSHPSNAGPANISTLREELNTVDEMHKKGVLTDDEYQRAKAKIIEKMAA